ncbi:hypothetical protein [Halorussus amylolyticus]|uniref:hypothetical protein n=1 Tax=Halorussus amylolyticus TaxID=1126242 RepID=UPI001045E074|nr:hypothetical protein [Halorussus amylolyticus]
MDDDPLVVWSLATFHAALLVVLLVVGLYPSGLLGWVLSGLDTSVGIALYLCLWASTWWTNRQCLSELGEDASLLAVVGLGGKWGGVNGVVFFWVLFAVAVAPAFGLRAAVIPSLLVFLGIGTVLALGIGGFVGCVFAALDTAAFRIADRLAPAAASESDSG